MKNDFEKDFSKLMNNVVFGKTMEHVRKHRDYKFVAAEKRRKYLVWEPNFHATKAFQRKCLSRCNEKNRDTYE